MSSELKETLIGLIVLVLGVGLALVGWSYPVTSCVTGTGISKSCTTDHLALLTAIALTGGGVGAIAFGGKMLWKA